MDPFFTHSFESCIENYGVGRDRKVWYRVLFLPEELAFELPFDEFPRLRVDGELNDVPTSGAWIPTGDGRRYLIISPKVLREANLKVGDSAGFRFRVADQDHVDVPEALLAAVNSQQQAKSVWENLTAGKKRALAYHVAGAKREDTIKKRVMEAMEAITERNGVIRKPRG